MDGNSSTTSPTQQTVPATLASLIGLALSFSALRDWLKILVLGGILEFCRRVIFSMWGQLNDSIFVTASFKYDDDVYDWMMYWLSQQPAWKKARNVQISTSTFGLVPIRVLSHDDDDSIKQNPRNISFLPNVQETYSIWYKYHWAQVTRMEVPTGYYGRSEETLQIRILTRNNDVLNDILREARCLYLAAQESKISIYVSDTSNNWRHVALRPKRPLQSIILDDGIKDLIINDAKDFLSSKEWYAQRGIPFRRGYLLYGAPGSGKTSLIHSLAGELGLDVYIVSLSRTGMDDATLSTLISELPEKCIALMEDIDAAFHHGLSREKETTDNVSKDGDPLESGNAPAAPQGKQENNITSSKLSLSGLLNALDGIAAQEGRILFATTNKYSSLDPALCRPGRMDLHVEFKLASKYQAGELFKRFYLPASESASGESEIKLENDEKSSTTGPSDLIDLGQEAPSNSASPPVAPSDVSEKKPYLSSLVSHAQRAPNLSNQVVCKLAAQFAAAIPEREFSMASLQGYLMTYKSRPYEAVNQAALWVAKEKVAKT